MPDYSKIRGFNYQPSYGSTSYENWIYFNAQIWELELRRGKEYFPGINAIRLWLDWEAWVRNPALFVEKLGIAVELCDRIAGAQVIPCLFNRWHNTFLDAGGIYLDHIVPGWSWVDTGESKFQPYLESVVGAFRNDPRILAWDLCNEPFSYTLPVDQMQYIEECEFQWLKRLYQSVKALGAIQDIGISIHPHHKKAGLERVAPIEDVLFIHPYYEGALEDEAYKANWLRELDDLVDVSNACGKPLLITECAWGALEDKLRAATLEFSLRAYVERGIGFLPHALHHSLLADLHDPAYGPVAQPGNLMFIGPNGRMRPYHDVFNQY